MEIDNLITEYFLMGLEQQDIVNHLRRDGVQMCIRTLRRKLKALNLFRRKNYSSVEDVVNYVEQQMVKSSSLHGYRWFWLKMITKGFTVKQETVRLALKALNPVGVEERKKNNLKRRAYYSQGANFTWHQDGYDKLKPYGICINGAVDGFSRYVTEQ